MKAKRRQILEILADGQFHSGEELGTATKITRSAVWKIIKQLMDLGVVIYSLKGKGYQIPDGLELLDEKKIRAHLSPTAKQIISQIEIFDSISSTNTYLYEKMKTSSINGQICLAEHQTAGKGRRGRGWHSPFGANLYFSLAWQFTNDPAELSGLSLAIAVAITRTLKQFGIEQQLALKWPNDVWWGKQKLAGVLLEIVAESHHTTKVIIGIGLNINMSQTNNISIDQAWTDIKKITGKLFSRNQLAGLLINEITTALTDFQTRGLIPFLPEWQKLDISRGHEVMLQNGERNIHGVALGITEKGELLVSDTNNNVKKFLSGEISLRLVTNDEKKISINH